MTFGTRRGARVLAIPVATLALVLSACQVNRLLDDQKLENEIRTGIEAQTDATVESVDCPDDVEIENGNVFFCTVSIDGGETAKVKVTQTSDDGDVRWEVTE